MNLYLLVGGPRTRKSSCSRALTGIGRAPRVVTVRMTSGDREVFVFTGGLQEAEWTAQKLINEVAKHRCSDVLVALRVRARRGAAAQFPDATKYIARFRAAGWRVSGLALLGATALPRHPQALPLPTSAVDPVNYTASRIRRAWQWS